MEERYACASLVVKGNQDQAISGQIEKGDRNSNRPFPLYASGLRFALGWTLAFDLRNTVLKNIERNVSLVLIQDERRSQPDGGFSAAEDEQPALKGQLNNAVAPCSSGLARLLVFDDLNADHQAAPAHVADDFMRLRPGAESVQHLAADVGGIGHSFALNNVQRC